MAEDREGNVDDTEVIHKGFFSWLFSWPVVGVFSAILLGFGSGLMTSPHPYIADAFCIAGIFVLLVKFWAWEESKHDTTRKTALLLLAGTLTLIAIAVGLCLLSAYLNKPPKTVASLPPQLSATLAPSPKLSLTPKAGAPKPDSGVVSQSGINNHQVVTQGTVSQSNSGGCNQQVIGGHDITNNCAPIQREITQETKTKLSSIIKGQSLPTFRIECVMRSQESCNYANSLYLMFRSMDPAWKGGIVSNMDMVTFQGISIFIAESNQNNPPDQAVFITNALNRSGIKVKITPLNLDESDPTEQIIDSDKFVLFVGNHP